jgi:zinc protease
MTTTQRPAPGAPRPFSFPAVTRHTLGNGARVHVVPLRRLPVATILLMFDAGAECDAPEHAGVAALAAAALAEGTRQRDAVALTEAFEELGGSLDTDATWTYAECSTTVLRPRLGDAMRLLAEVVREPAFPEEEVARLREERLSELLQQRAEPRGLADDMFARVCFAPEARYARPIGGDEASVASLTGADVRTHHGRFMVPSRATLVVVGDVDVPAVVQLAESVLGDWQATAGSPPLLTASPRTMSPGVHLVQKADAPQSELRIGHSTVPRTHPDFHALAVMNAILGGLFNSRINLNLRERHGYTYGAFSHLDWRRAASLFEVSTAVRSDVSAAAVREILGEIERLRSDRVNETERSLAIDYLTGVFPIRFETTAAIADALALQQGFGLPSDYYDTYRARIAAVSAEDIQRVAREHLRPEALQIVAVGDADEVRERLADLSLGAVREYDASGAEREV